MRLISLSVGCAIHCVNGVPVGTIEERRADPDALAATHGHSAVVLQIERDGKPRLRDVRARLAAVYYRAIEGMAA